MNRRQLFSGAMMPLAALPIHEHKDKSYLGGTPQCGECVHVMETTPVYEGGKPWEGGKFLHATAECVNRECSRFGIVYRLPMTELERDVLR